MQKFLVILVLSLLSNISYGQNEKILKGASDFRKNVLENFLFNFQQVEKIRQKLDSLGVEDQDFDRFCSHLSYVSKNLYNGELEGRQFMVEFLKSNKAYKNLTQKELAIVIENLDFIFILRNGIWQERYPHKLDIHSLRLKEISQYDVKEGDRILHFAALNNQLSIILYLSYDSVHVTYHPFSFKKKENKIFDLISSSGQNPTSSLEYSFEKHPKPVNNRFYDKVIFDCLGILFFKEFPNFEKKFKTIHNILAADGELIVGANYQLPVFDGPFREISEIDKKVERILKCGFDLKEKIHSEGEYIIYKFIKEQY